MSEIRRASVDVPVLLPRVKGDTPAVRYRLLAQRARKQYAGSDNYQDYQDRDAVVRALLQIADGLDAAEQATESPKPVVLTQREAEIQGYMELGMDFVAASEAQLAAERAECDRVANLHIVNRYKDTRLVATSRAILGLVILVAALALGVFDLIPQMVELTGSIVGGGAMGWYGTQAVTTHRDIRRLEQRTH